MNLVIIFFINQLIVYSMNVKKCSAKGPKLLKKQREAANPHSGEVAEEPESV